MKTELSGGGGEGVDERGRVGEREVRVGERLDNRLTCHFTPRICH